MSAPVPAIPPRQGRGAARSGGCQGNPVLKRTHTRTWRRKVSRARGRLVETGPVGLTRQAESCRRGRYACSPVWIGDVDVPEELLAAARTDRMVIFVGAGASRDAPSNLPDFQQLTSNIARESAIPFEPGELDWPDRLLGRIALADVDVHNRVRSHIDVPGSAPNALHAAIVALASAALTTRIVTTDYDSHLSTAMHEAKRSCPEYMAPALPMGDDFEGIVYLHGSLRQEPRHLVVTDADFGRAYLRDAWAARFLERMFANFTVLFIGYSHGDIVMQYLARSLGPSSSRFVMTRTPEAPDWRRLGIHPVGYSSHQALPEAIGRWARLLSMRLLDHRQRIGQLVSAPPSEVPEETSYLTSVIEGEDTVRLFTALARGEDWLTWTAAQTVPRRLFDPRDPGEDRLWTLARWFAQQWLADEEHSEAGLSLVAGAGGRLSTTLWDAIGQQLHILGGPRQAWLRPWIALLVQNAPADERDWLDYALVSSQLPDDRDAALLLFEHLTAPKLVAKPSFGAGARYDIEIRGDNHWLNEAWEKVFRPVLPSVVADLLAIADGHLRDAHRLLAVAGAAKGSWDPISFGRSSIAPHEQDRFGDRIGIIIDVARDSLAFCLNEDPSSAEAAIRSWASSTAPILRRLAIHGVAIDPTRDGTAKLSWLLDRGFATDLHLKHEVFELLEAALPSAEEPAVDGLIAVVTSRPSDPEDKGLGAYETFNALEWINRYTSATSAAEALSRSRADHPEFGVRDHPDFNMWSSGGFRASKSPMPTDELHALLHQDRDAAIRKLDEAKRNGFPSDEPTREDAIALVRQVVADHPGDGLALLGDGSDLPEDLIRATLEGWHSGVIDDEVADQVTERLSALELDRWGAELARILGWPGGAEQRTQWPRFKGARDLARRIEGSLAAEPVPNDAPNWLDRATNATGGLLAEFWLRVVSLEWNGNPDSWTGMSTESRDAIETLLRRHDLHGACAEVVLASQALFVFSADRQWCEANVLPLLDWTEPNRARRAWDGFLTWGRWTDPLLDAGLLRDYLDTALHIEAFDDDMRRQFADHVAAVSLYSEMDPTAWVAEFTRAAPEGVRVAWLDRISWTLKELDADVRQQQWARWMRGYWAGRIEGVPLQLTFDEASAMAGWVAHLGVAIDEAVDLAVRTPAGLGQHGLVLRDLGERADQSPAACARLLGHLLTGTKQPFWGCDMVKEIFTKVGSEASHETVTQIREHALRLGCTGAADW